MNWDDLRFILAIEREGTLTAAAAELGVNHSTVSRRLAALEDEVGCRLFDRQPTGYVATDAGSDVVGVAQRVEEAVHSLDRRVIGRDTRLHGPVRLTTFDGLAVRHINLFQAFQRRYPAIELEISVENAPVSLTRREADVALRLSNRPPEHLVGRKILRAEFALYGHRELVAEHGDELAAYPWLAWDERLGARLTQEWMQQHVPDAQIAAVIDSSALMIRSVQLGFGIQFLICAEGDGHPDLVRLRPPEPGFGMDLWVLTHPDLRGTARVKAFMDHLYDGLREHADQYAGVLPD